jgi:hypothetical protein
VNEADVKLDVKELEALFQVPEASKSPSSRGGALTSF